MKTLVTLILMIALAGAGWFWWQKQQPVKDPNNLTLYGNVDIRQISLAFEGTGRIAKMNAEEGDKVTAGQVIGLLDTRTLELQLKQAQAQSEVQKQTLLRLRNGSRPEEIAQVRSQLKSAETEVSRTSKDLSRLQTLEDTTEGAVSLQSLDQAKASYAAAKARADEVRENVRLVEIGPRDEEVAAAEAQLASSDAEIALLEHQINQGTLIAPTDAVVRSRLLEPGDMITPQKPVYALALTHPKWIRVYIHEPDLGKIKPGMTANVKIDSFPDQKITGKIGYISSVAEFTPKAVQTEELRTNLVYEVRVIVDDPQNILRLGQPATVTLGIKAAQ